MDPLGVKLLCPGVGLAEEIIAQQAVPGIPGDVDDGAGRMTPAKGREIIVRLDADGLVGALPRLAPEMETPVRRAVQFGVEPERRKGLAAHPVEQHGQAVDQPGVARPGIGDDVEGVARKEG